MKHATKMNLFSAMMIAMFFLVLTGAASAQSSVAPNSASGWAEVDNHYITVSRASTSGPETYPISATPSGIMNLPASFTLTAGQSSNYFYFTTNAVQVDTPVTVTIGAKQFTYTVKAVKVTSTSPQAVSFLGHGSQQYMHVYLPCVAKAGGFSVALTSSNPTALPVPATVTIGAGSSSNYFYFQPRDVAVDTPVTISATLNGNTYDTALVVKPIFTAALNPQVTTMYGGALTPYAYIYLNGGPFESYVLNMTSSHPTALAPPATVAIGAGGTSNYFYMASGLVNTPTNVTITAKSNLLGAGAPARTCTILVKPNSPSVINTSQAVIYGGSGSQYHYIYLPAPPLSTAPIAITSSNPAVLTGPDTVNIGAGSTNNYFYSTSALVAQDYNVKLTATYSGNSASVDVLVKPLRIINMVLTPASIQGGTGSPYFYLYFPAPTLATRTISLLSSNPAVLQLPSTMNIGAGSANNYSYFTTSAVTVPKYVDITAFFNGNSFTQPFAVTPPNNQTISGQIYHNDLFDPSVAPTSFDIELRTPNTTNVVHTITVPIVGGDQYYFTPPDGQTYDVSYKFGTFLRKTIKNVTKGKTHITFNMINGDVDGDNAIGLFDYLILSDAFDTSEGDANYVAEADLDKDGVVSLFDYLVLSAYFDYQGDE